MCVCVCVCVCVCHIHTYIHVTLCSFSNQWNKQLKEMEKKLAINRQSREEMEKTHKKELVVSVFLVVDGGNECIELIC